LEQVIWPAPCIILGEPSWLKFHAGKLISTVDSVTCQLFKRLAFHPFRHFPQRL